MQKGVTVLSLSQSVRHCGSRREFHLLSTAKTKLAAACGRIRVSNFLGQVSSASLNVHHMQMTKQFTVSC